jgi:hypothetical protein
LADRTDPRTIAAAAQRLIARFGERAASEAALRENELAQAGNIEGATRWKLIRKAIIDERGSPRLRPL